MGKVGTLLLSLTLLAACAPASAETLDDVVRDVEAAYGRTTDLRAEFTQNAFNKSLNQTIPAQGVELPAGRVLGKEARRPKRATLRELVAGGDAARMWFVEDRLATLRDVTAEPALAGASLFLAAWGYNTPKDREAAGRDGRIVLLALDRFAADFPAWLEA